MLAMNFKVKCDSVRILATVSVGALAMATVPAMAHDATAAPQQPAASQTKYDGDAIVVTGITKPDANIQDTPIAIPAFSAETLPEQGIVKDRYSFVSGQSLSVRVDIGGRRCIKK